MPERKEGFVIVTLLALSTMIMLTIVGTICVVGSKHYKLYREQQVLAESQRIEVESGELDHEATMLQILV